MFNPMRDIPTTDEEVMIALQRSDEITTASLQGLYSIFKEQGLSLLKAYEKALLAHLEACGITKTH